MPPSGRGCDALLSNSELIKPGLDVQQKVVSLASASLLLACLGCHCPLVVPVGPLPTGNLKEMLLPLQGWGPGFLVSVGTGVKQGILSLPYHLCCKEGGHSKILFLGVLGQLDPCSVLAAPKNGAEDHLLGLILGLQILLMSL